MIVPTRPGPSTLRQKRLIRVHDGAIELILEMAEDPRILHGDGTTHREQEAVLLKDRVIELGLHVRVQGLEKGVQYNGLAGQVVGYNDETGRVQVALLLVR